MSKASCRHVSRAVIARQRSTIPRGVFRRSWHSGGPWRPTLSERATLESATRAARDSRPSRPRGRSATVVTRTTAAGRTPGPAIHSRPGAAGRNDQFLPTPWQNGWQSARLHTALQPPSHLLTTLPALRLGRRRVPGRGAPVAVDELVRAARAPRARRRRRLSRRPPRPSSATASRSDRTERGERPCAGPTVRSGGGLQGCPAGASAGEGGGAAGRARTSR